MVAAPNLSLTKWSTQASRNGTGFLARSTRLRTSSRRFYQHHWTGTSWALGVKGTYAERKIPYRLPELKAALQANPDVQVQICEGESDADAMARLGFVTTTNPGGALSWAPELTSWLRTLGVRRAVIHEDNDKEAQGFKGPKRSALLTAELASFIELKVVRYPDVPDGEDVRWWLEHGHTKLDLDVRIGTAAPATPPLPFINFANWDRVYCSPVLRHPAGLIQAANFRSAIAF